MQKILLVLAHPDDESFAVGGTVAKYSASGNQIFLLCATRGQAGSSGGLNVSGEALGQAREMELQNAASVLGITETKILDYKDGKLSDLNPGELEAKIYDYLESVLPEAVITFDPSGISNHPDHMKICLSTTVAFQRYASWLVSIQKKARIYGSHPEDWFLRLEKLLQKAMEPKLYYACMPESIATYAKKIGAIPTESFGRPWLGTPDKKITTVINIVRYKAKKIQALHCHRSQISDVERIAALDPNPLLDQEYFVQRYSGQTEVFMGKNDPIGDRL